MTDDAARIRLCLDSFATPEDVSLSSLEAAVQPILLSGLLGVTPTRMAAGLQYHLGGEMDTRALGLLAELGPDDTVMDECCFIGGPALQLAMEFGCRVTGVDIMARALDVASGLARATGLSDRVSFVVGDARDLPFPDCHFSVVWNQCSLEHDERWIEELDRVLQPRGRMALTLQIVTGERDPHDAFGRWRLEDVITILTKRGYGIVDCSDLTSRDVVFGWEVLIDKIERNRDVYIKHLGEEWLESARKSLEEDAKAMRMREFGNGRIVARKSG